MPKQKGDLETKNTYFTRPCQYEFARLGTNLLKNCKKNHEREITETTFLSQRECEHTFFKDTSTKGESL